MTGNQLEYGQSTRESGWTIYVSKDREVCALERLPICSLSYTEVIERLRKPDVLNTPQIYIIYITALSVVFLEHKNWNIFKVWINEN